MSNSMLMEKMRTYVKQKLIEGESVYYRDLSPMFNISSTTANQKLYIICKELGGVYQRGYCRPE